MHYPLLFNPGVIGALDIANRIVMAPMTRARTAQPEDAPRDLMATYYAQRAQAGLIVSEATQISAQGKGYSFTPGIYTNAQIAGWRKVTDAVHAAGGRIFCQLWHVGRMSHASLHEDGMPVAPSAIAPEAKVWIVGEDGVGQMLDCPTPRALTQADIQAIIRDYRQAALNAMEAGFDGVEIHGANGYLIDQFLRATANQRDDDYGGSLDNRIRFVQEVARTVCDAIGAHRVGIRLSPFITQRGMNDPEAPVAILTTARTFNELGMAYIHLAEADWDDAPPVPDSFRRQLREVFSGAVIVAGNYNADKANAIIKAGHADYVAFGRMFLANPDLPYRLQHNLELNAITDPSTLFGGDAAGYTDYPSYASGAG
ncbi:N-ethylmaleimide reductase [Hahella sp. KA22]|uniref:alkene reductase n=1 Tax=Hahella sp. KA22 TaxID=1628392 RepID=UPI000FDF319D|nr:alkene reductase [Hahella sp. KA22]AZZ94240.1 alkene reductase [Hahella sp. KA22]QAY57614.1 N-ethylmaleimide reductase [Hahella sp. KA22]